MASSSFNPNGLFVRLGHNGPQEHATPEETALFFDSLPTNTTTKHLHIGSSVFNMERLATELKVNTTLTDLSLVGAKPGEDATVAVIDALTINSTLISLNVSYSTCVSTLVAQKIGAMLEVNSTLQHLALANCNIDDQKAIALTRTLGINSTLTSLKLGHNVISAEGAQEISKALSLNMTLTEISFGSNRSLGDKGVSALIDATLLNPSLTSLDMNAVELTLDSTPKIVELIQTTSSLKKLDIRSVAHLHDKFVADTILSRTHHALLLNGTITSLCVIPSTTWWITDRSKTIDAIGLRNEYNLGQKAVSLFELLRNHLIKVVPEENFPIPQYENPEKNFLNPHRSSFIDLRRG